jgi:anaerobic ribonucleoside-triphosphate reductase
MTEAILNGRLPPPVRRSDGVIEPFDKERIVKSLVKETQLVKVLYNLPPMSEEDARKIAEEVEEDIKNMKLRFLSGPLIRELVSVKLLEHGFDKYRNVYTRVGMPLYDVYSIDRSEGYEAKENANLQPNPETFHKKKADFLSKESYLLMMPPRIADAHLRGDIHIHDLEYWGTRPFCQDHDLRYFFYYGLMPDGTGTHTSVAGPAKHAEVAILHAAKVLGAAQTNFAGGQGFFNFTVFMAPYLVGLDDKKIHQLAQMFLYEMTQLYVARGGQPVFSSIQIEAGVPKVWQDAPVVSHGKVWRDLTYGSLEDHVHAFANALLDEYLKGDAMGRCSTSPSQRLCRGGGTGQTASLRT